MYTKAFLLQMSHEELAELAFGLLEDREVLQNPALLLRDNVETVVADVIAKLQDGQFVTEDDVEAYISASIERCCSRTEDCWAMARAVDIGIVDPGFYEGYRDADKIVAVWAAEGLYQAIVERLADVFGTWNMDAWIRQTAEAGKTV